MKVTPFSNEKKLAMIKFTKSLFCFLFIFITIFSVKSQVTLPHYDGLNYTVGQGLQTQANWSSLNSGDALLIASGNLTGASMPAPTGNKVTFDGAGIDASKAFTQQTSGTVYFSFLLNVTSLGSLNTTGSYFSGFVEGATTNFGGTVWLRADGAGYDIGVNPRTTAANTVWSSGTTAINGTHLVVISYQIVSGTANDVVKLWLDPVWGAAEPAATLTATNTGTDLANVNRILVRQDASTTTPFVEMDEFRIGLSWASVASTVNGSIASGEYGTHTNGQNQQSSATGTWYMNWDENNLYIGLAGTNTSEGAILYLDKNPVVPVDGGTNSDGTIVGFNNYDGTSFASLQFRADLVVYFKDSYREFRTANGSNGWSSATSGFGLYASSSGNRELSIPWSAIGGRPSSFNWFGHVAYTGGGAYASVPTENPGSGAGLIIGSSARWKRYFTVSTTTIGSATPPFSRNSFVFNNTSDENGFGAISVYDFTMNSSGRYISRTGATGANWSIAGNMVVGNGTIYIGSGGTNGAYGSTTITGDLDIRGGTLDMDQTTSPVTVNGNLLLSSGNFNLSGNSYGGGDLVLKGNLTRTSGTFTPNGRAVFLNAASGDQTITGATTFDFVFVDKTAGSVVLANDITCSQTLNLTNGTINTSSNKVIISNSATGSVARTNGYVNGNLQRAIATGANTYNFAVGTASGYTPVSLAFSAVSGAGNITVNSADAAGANYPSALHATKLLARNWNITNNGVTGITGDATFTYLPADLAGGAASGNLKAYVHNGSHSYPASNSNTANSFNYNGLTTFGEFGAGECKGTQNATFTKTMASACGGGADGTITVTPMVGTASPYTYSWTSNPSGFSASTAAVTGLSPRDYSVTVTEATGCAFTLTDITIWQALAPTVSNNGGISGSCNNTGYIVLYGSNGVPPFTYSVDGVTYQGSNTFLNLAAGTYTGYVKDSAGCIGTKPNIVIGSAAALVVTAYPRPASSCANNGSIELYRTGGIPPYSYSLDDVTYQSSNTFSNLAGGSYTGWVMDSKGCKSSLAGINVTQAPAITVTATKINTSACSNTGYIEIQPGGGVPGYTYSITGPSGPWQASNRFTGLAAGTYNAWVQDSKGCKNAQFGVVIGTDAASTITVTAYPRSASSCANNGIIELYRTGGVGPYTYSLDNVTYQVSNTFTGLAGGTYTGWVKDSKGCTGSLAGIIVNQDPALTTTESHANTSACVNDGFIQVRPSGGVAPYTYSLDNVTYQGSAYFTGLAAGSYTAWAKDLKGCTASMNVTISQNTINVSAYAAPASSCETSNGSIQLFRTGGFGPYTYSLDNVTYQASNVFSGLTAGTYTGYVKDSRGCISSLSNITVGPNCAPPLAGMSKILIREEMLQVSMQVFPNPTNDAFSLLMPQGLKGKVSITVTDILGKRLLQDDITGKQRYSFGYDLKPGVYMVRVSGGGMQQSLKVIKQ